MNIQPVKAYLLCSEGAIWAQATEEVLGPWETERAAMIAGLATRRRSLASQKNGKALDFSIHVLDAVKLPNGHIRVGNVLETNGFLGATVKEEEAVLLRGIAAKIFKNSTLPALESQPNVA